MATLKHFYTILIATFIVGFFAGVYLYFFTRQPIEPKPEDGTARGFEITGDQYGGCQLVGSCPSYRIEENGRYTYISGVGTDETSRFEDRISESRVKDLAELLRRTDLESIEDSEFSGTCPAAFDGPAYRYEIRTEGVTHVVDTCVEDVNNTPLFETLADYFTIFSLTHRND